MSGYVSNSISENAIRATEIMKETVKRDAKSQISFPRERPKSI